MKGRGRKDGDMTVRVLVQAKEDVDMDVRVAISFNVSDASSKKRTFWRWLGPSALNFTEHHCVRCEPIDIAFHREDSSKKWTF